MVLCNVLNCEFNDDKSCDICPIIDSEGQCTNIRIDDNKCEYCGATMIPKIINGNLEHFGTPTYEMGYVCPNGCN